MRYYDAIIQCLHAVLLHIFTYLLHFFLFSFVLLRVPLPFGGILKGDKQRYYEQMLATAERNLEAERQIVSQLHADRNELQRKYDEIKQEAINADGLLKLQKQTDIKALQDENHLKGQLLQRVTHEHEMTRKKLDEERKRAQAFSVQVFVLLPRRFLLQASQIDPADWEFRVLQVHSMWVVEGSVGISCVCLKTLSRLNPFKRFC